MKLITLLSFIAFMAFSSQLYAQCRGFAKRKCRPQLGAYMHDGKLNVAQLYAGDKAEIKLTFYKGQSYRLLVCSDDVFKKVTYAIYDTDKNKVFDSVKRNQPYFDFKVGATQQLIVEIKIPQDGNRSRDKSEITGCVSVMAGIK